MEKIRPFGNGSEFMVWRERNCYICKNGYDWEKMSDMGINARCFAETNLAIAYISDGQINEPTAKFIGLKDGWDCPHREER